MKRFVTVAALWVLCGCAARQVVAPTGAPTPMACSDRRAAALGEENTPAPPACVAR